MLIGDFWTTIISVPGVSGSVCVLKDVCDVDLQERLCKCKRVRVHHPVHTHCISCDFMWLDEADKNGV